MQRHIAATALLVRDYDEALEFFVEKLNFVVLEDTQLGSGKRWVTIAPGNLGDTRLLLAEARGPEQERSVGHQAGGRVFLFLHTDDFWRDFHSMTAKGVRFIEQPRNEPYGLVVVFEDLYGNRWDLLEPKGSTKTL